MFCDRGAGQLRSYWERRRGNRLWSLLVPHEAAEDAARVQDPENTGGVNSCLDFQLMGDDHWSGASAPRGRARESPRGPRFKFSIHFSLSLLLACRVLLLWRPVVRAVCIVIESKGIQAASLSSERP